MTKTVFLETHNLKNNTTSLTTFNFELIMRLSKLDFNNLELTLDYQTPVYKFNYLNSVYKKYICESLRSLNYNFSHENYTHQS
jgi:hypothetical protein